MTPEEFQKELDNRTLNKQSQDRYSQLITLLTEIRDALKPPENPHEDKSK